MKYTAVQTQKTDDIDSLTTREMLWIIRWGRYLRSQKRYSGTHTFRYWKTPEYIIVPTFDSDPYVPHRSLPHSETPKKS